MTRYTFTVILGLTVVFMAVMGELAVSKKNDTIRLLRAELAQRGVFKLDLTTNTPAFDPQLAGDVKPEEKSPFVFYTANGTLKTNTATAISNLVLWGAVTADIPEMRKFETDIPQTNIAETIVIGEDDQEYGFKLQTPGNIFEVKYNGTNVLVITQDCRIEYNCPPTEAAKLFLDALTNIVGAYRTRLSLKDQP